jgi:RNA polymerase sigma-70 factor (ECF subfamily)
MKFPFRDPDAVLVARTQQGDSNAFDALVCRHRSRVYRLAYAMMRDREAAEDVTVEAFCEAYRAIGRFKPRAKFTTWLHRVAVNVCLEHLRRKRAKHRLVEVELDPNAPAVDDTWELVLTRDLADRAIQAIGELPETHKAPVSMFYLEQLSCAEIAETLGIPRNTVKTRIFYATRTLRDRLAADVSARSEGGTHA